MRVEVNIDTLGKINDFVAICTRLNHKINLVDGSGYCVSAKSLMGAIATFDWSNVYVECEEDIHTYINDFIVK